MNHLVSQSLSESDGDDPETEHDGARTDSATGEASEPEPEVKGESGCCRPLSKERRECS